MYENWIETLSLTKLYWYSVSSLVNYLHELREIILSNQSVKTIHFKLTSFDDKTLPASKIKRFPDNDAYLCEGIGNLTEKLDKLNLAVKVMINPQRLQRNYMEYKTVGEIEIYVLEKINQLLCELDQNTEMIITREVFESRNRLNWTESTHENPTRQVGNSISTLNHSTTFKNTSHNGNGKKDNDNDTT